MRVVPIVFHIPHASTFIPAGLRDQFVLGDDLLQREIELMTDWFTDELFQVPDEISMERVIAYASRLVTDVERIPVDDAEPMSELGMGMFYMLTSSGEPLRRELSADEQNALFETYYRPHHQRLNEAVDRVLHRFGACCIIDCHSFPKEPLPYEDARLKRPEVCIGTDNSHTPDALVRCVLDVAAHHYGEVALNTPFAGSLVSGKHWGVSDNVFSVMVEVRRDVYCVDGRLSSEAMTRFASFLFEVIDATSDFTMAYRINR